MSEVCLSVAVGDSGLLRVLAKTCIPLALYNPARLLKCFKINERLHIYNVSVILVLLGNMIIYQQNTHGTLAHNIMGK